MKKLTAAQMTKKDNEIEAYASAMLKKYDAAKVAIAVWNKYGYLSGTKNGQVIISGFRRIVVG